MFFYDIKCQNVSIRPGINHLCLKYTIVLVIDKTLN